MSSNDNSSIEAGFARWWVERTCITLDGGREGLDGGLKVASLEGLCRLALVDKSALLPGQLDNCDRSIGHGRVYTRAHLTTDKSTLPL